MILIIQMKKPSEPKLNPSHVTVFVIVILVFLIGVVLVFASGGPSKNGTTAAAGSTTVENNRQIARITAKGGYHPGEITAQPGLPTTLQITTDNTYDCSAAFSIPSLNISKMLPLSGTTDIDIPAQPAGTTLTGTCAMGMYRLNIKF
jgi:plastocyanin domain-containing protein